MTQRHIISYALCNLSYGNTCDWRLKTLVVDEFDLPLLKGRGREVTRNTSPYGEKVRRQLESMLLISRHIKLISVKNVYILSIIFQCLLCVVLFQSMRCKKGNFSLALLKIVHFNAQQNQTWAVHCYCIETVTYSQRSILVKVISCTYTLTELICIKRNSVILILRNRKYKRISKKQYLWKHITNVLVTCKLFVQLHHFDGNIYSSVIHLLLKCTKMVPHC